MRCRSNISDALSVRSLRKEYRLFGRLNNTKHAAHVLDSGTAAVDIGGFDEICFCVVSEYISGDELGVWLENYRKENGGPLSAQDFFLMARKLTEALSEIHQAVVVHGDIWPPNIVIREKTEPVFIDFGQSVIRKEVAISTSDENS